LSPTTFSKKPNAGSHSKRSIEINERVRRLRKRHAQWQPEGKRAVDSSKTYVEWDLRVW